MVQIIRLHGDPHIETQKLLPWYANASLEAGEAAAVEEHLAVCAECRADLKLEHILSAGIAGLPLEAEDGWATLRARVQSESAHRTGASRSPFAGFPRRPAPRGWVITAQAACVALAVATGWMIPKPTTQPLYQALGSAPAPASGNMVVVFQPTTSEQELRGLLVRSGARLVDGPTASDAYVLRVAAAQRNVVLARFRSDRHVVLAEPIDGAAKP
jgi:hypothetical protein